MQKLWILFLTSIFLISVFVSCDMNSTDQSVKIVAHRGAMLERPENTMAAFERALEVGSDIIEVDIRTSRDGKLFVLHDATLDRTTNGSGLASELTMEELKELDAGSWFDEDYASEQIPPLREVLQWARYNDVPILLDLKESGTEFTGAVASEIETYGDVESNIIGVRSVEQALDFRNRIPDAPQLGFIRSPDRIEDFAQAGVDVIRLWLQRGWLDENPGLADRVRNSGKKLMINGSHGEPEEARKLMDFDPDWILIDDPLTLKESLQQADLAGSPKK